MQTNALEMILNHLGDTAVYVIRQDNREILYFNEKTRQVTPEIRLGMKCFDVTVHTPLSREVFCGAKPEFFGAKRRFLAVSVHREACYCLQRA